MQEIIERFCEARGGQGEGGDGEEGNQDGEYVAVLDLKELVLAYGGEYCGGWVAGRQDGHGEEVAVGGGRLG